MRAESLPVLYNKIYNYDMFARYLVDQRWLKQWKKYVGFESWNLTSAGKQKAHLGPVDNVDRFKCILIIIVLQSLFF